MAKKREKESNTEDIGAYIMMSVESGKERIVYAKLRKMKEVILINELFGEWDLIIGINISDSKELDTFVSDKIRKIKEVGLTSTMIVAR